MARPGNGAKVIENGVGRSALVFQVSGGGSDLCSQTETRCARTELEVVWPHFRSLLHVLHTVETCRCRLLLPYTEYCIKETGAWITQIIVCCEMLFIAFDYRIYALNQTRISYNIYREKMKRSN